jgi:hypothetical protein
VSNSLAVATVTVSLADLLQEFIGAVPGARAMTMNPESESLRGGDPIVNVYLYRVTQNPARLNQDAPARTPAGGPIQHPRLAVNLDYLITFFGNDAKLEPQLLLGSVVAGLHAQPILSPASIARAIASIPSLTGSNLAESGQPVRFTAAEPSTAELAWLWGRGLPGLSVAYQASGLELD